MAINFTNFLYSQNKKSKMGDFQDLEHIDGLSISSTSANLYNHSRDDLVMFYFRRGANYASVYTQSKIISENIKWNLNLKNKKIMALVVNTRNANVFTGKKGFRDLKEIADELSMQLTEKQKELFKEKHPETYYDFEQRAEAYQVQKRKQEEKSKETIKQEPITNKITTYLKIISFSNAVINLFFFD